MTYVRISAVIVKCTACQRMYPLGIGQNDYDAELHSEGIQSKSIIWNLAINCMHKHTDTPFSRFAWPVEFLNADITLVRIHYIEHIIESEYITESRISRCSYARRRGERSPRPESMK